MRVPVIAGVIRRRLLVNFRIDPDVVQRLLPRGLSPKIHDGAAVAGICLIRLEQIRPRRLPALFGISSENAAHRVAVTWQDASGTHEGVYIPRRDTNSSVNHLAGGHLFPGEHHRAVFSVNESSDRVAVSMASTDGEVSVDVCGSVTNTLPSSSGFASLTEASAFFERGSLGYSATSESNRLDGVVLRTREWLVEPLLVERARSSYFENRAVFPEGSVKFDCALIMRNIHHEWHAADDLYVNDRTEQLDDCAAVARLPHEGR